MNPQSHEPSLVAYGFKKVASAVKSTRSTPDENVLMVFESGSWTRVPEVGPNPLGLGVGVDVGMRVAVGVGTGVAVGEGVGVGTGVAVGEGVGTGVGAGTGVTVGCTFVG